MRYLHLFSSKLVNKSHLLRVFIFILFCGITSTSFAVTKTVGTGGNYATLRAAFAAINNGTITGDIVLQIITSTTETLSPQLLASGTGSSNYNSVTIYPKFVGLSISGSIGNPIVDLYGADNVTVDGRVNQSGSASLTLSNTNTGSSVDISTVRLTADATNNTVKYCNINGSPSNSSTGVVVFLTGTSSGNDNNLIDHNNITTYDNANRPKNVIYSWGASSFENSNNTISNNNIYNFINTGANSYGINILSNSTNFIISNNSFYETSPLAPTTSSAQTIINIDNTSGNSFTVSGNYIGGQSALCGGSAWTKTNTNTNVFNGIYLNVGTSITSSIDGNTIQNISYSNNGNYSLNAIYINGGNVNIGTTSGNLIGASTGTGSITFTNSTTGGFFYGIRIESTGTVDCRNNTIGAITATNSDGALATSFYGIYKNNTAGTTTISNNLIGSSGTSNSIQTTSASTANVQTLVGIRSSGTGSNTISSNTVSNITNYTSNGDNAARGYISGIFVTDGTSNSITSNTVKYLTISNASNGSSYTASVTGIALSDSISKTVTGNTISNLTNSYAGFTGYIYGIFAKPGSSSNIITTNFIHSLSAPSSNAATQVGLFLGTKTGSSATANISNNIISLGDNSESIIYGIKDNGGYAAINFNTVYISGSNANQNSYALESSNSNSRNIQNNLFVNARSSTTSGTNYATSLGSTNLTQNHNNLYVSGTGGLLSNSTNYSDESLTLNKNLDPGFASAGGTTAANYIPSNANLGGINTTGISTDYAGTSRSTPSMGAYEVSVNANVQVYVSGTLRATYQTLKNSMDAINTGLHTGAIHVKINNSTTETATSTLYQSGYNSTSSYTSVTIYPTATGKTISGDLAMPLISLNGADNVTLDGRVNATGSTTDLSITNANTSGGTTSTLQFINDATNNTVQYCNLKGSTSGTGTGIVFFSTAAAGGNDNNTITNNNITCASDANRPRNAIYSLGSVSNENDHITISNNNIYDILNRANASNGVNLAGNTTISTISGNSFYETASFVPTGTGTYRVIYLNNTSGVNFTVSNNSIGGQAALCGGSAWTKTNGSDNTFYAIDVNVGTGTASNIQGNTIKNISYSNSITSNWYGIAIEAGDVNLGTSSANTIGAATGTASISFTGNGSSSELYGIQIVSTGTVDCQNNIIGSITTNNSNTINNTNFYGINKGNGAGTTTISNNQIGSSSTVNSIQTSSTSTTDPQTLIGIRSSGSGSTTISANRISNATNSTNNTDIAKRGYISGIFTSDGTSNTISNNHISYLSISNKNSGASNNCSVTGISCNDTISRTITNNEISYLSNTNAAFGGTVSGIFFKSAITSNIVSSNFIHDLTVNSSTTTASINGLIQGALTATPAMANIMNNLVSLGGNTQTTITGLRDNAGYSNFYYNTFYLSGSLGSGVTNLSYGVYSNNNKTRTYQNNLFINARSTISGSNLHYGLYVSTGTGLTQSYNDYFVSGTGGILSNGTYYSGTGNININPNFVSAGGTLSTNYYPQSTSLAGTVIGSITTDFGGRATRSGSTPVMGAWEIHPMTINSFSVSPYKSDVHSGYVGSTVTISGTYLGNVTIVKLGGAGGTTINTPTISETSVTFTTPGAVTGQIYVSDGVNNTTSVDSYTENGYVTGASGDWNTAASWLGNAIPGTAANATIAHQLTVTPSVQTIGDLTVNTGAQLTLNNTLTVNGTLANSGTIIVGTSGQLGGTLTGITNTNAGTIQVQNTSSSALASGKSWPDLVQYNGSSKQTITRGNFENMTISNSAGTTLSGTDSIAVSGTLTINSGYIEIGTGRKVEANTITNNVGVDGIYVNAGSGAPNGTLVYYNGSPVSGTVEFYTKAYYDAAGPVNSKYKWQYFGSPLTTVTANPTLYGSYVRSYKESTGSWISLKNDSVLKPMRGYEITQTSPKTISFSGNINNQNLSTTLAYTNNGIHLLSNPYTCALDIRQLSFGAGLDASVYLFNTGSSSDWTANNTSPVGYDNPGQYITVPKNLAGTGGLPYKIPSMQGFIVTTNGNPGALSTVFSTTYATAKTPNSDLQRVKKRTASASTTGYTRIHVLGTRYGDQMMMVDNSECSTGFDNGWDGRKMFGSSLTPQIYAQAQDENLQVAATNNYDNTDIGFIPGEDTEYTMSIVHSNITQKYPTLYLLDMANGSYTDITADSTSYSFSSSSSDPTVRFRIVTSAALATKDEQLVGQTMKVESQQKDILITNPGDGGYSLSLFDAMGAKVLQKEVSTGLSRIHTMLSSGVYFYAIRNTNGTLKSGKLLIE